MSCVRFQNLLILHKKSGFSALWKHSHDHRCSRCQQLHEDWSHIFTCPSITQDFKKTHLTDPREKLNSFKLSAPMVTALLDGINSWLTSSTPTFSLTCSSPEDSHLLSTKLAFLDQTDIGWDHSLCGKLAKSWFSAHDGRLHFRS